MTRTFSIEDRIRGGHFLWQWDEQIDVERLLEAIVTSERLPTRTLRRRPLHYRLVWNGTELRPGTSLRSADVPDGATLLLESPDARPVWIRVQQLMHQVEDELEIETKRQQQRLRSRLQDEIDATVDGVVDSITQPIRDVRDQAERVVRSTGETLTADLSDRIDGIKTRVLDEISARLRGSPSTIGAASRTRARRDLARLARTGVLGEDGEPIRRSLRSLAAMGAERVAVIGTVAVLAMVTTAVALSGDEAEPPAAPQTTPPTSSTSTSASSGGLAARLVSPMSNEVVDAGSRLTVRWAIVGDPDPTRVAVTWAAPTSDAAAAVIVPGSATSAEIDVPGDGSDRLWVSVIVMAGSGEAESERVSVRINRPPTLDLPSRSVVIRETDDPMFVVIGAGDPDADATRVEVEATSSALERSATRIRVDPRELGLGAFGACVTVEDQRGLSAHRWLPVTVVPAISPGDSLWRIARRLLVADGTPEPSNAQITERMGTLRIQRWLLDPDLILSTDQVTQVSLLEPITPIGPCAPG